MARLRECLVALQEAFSSLNVFQVEVQIKEITQLSHQRFSNQELGLYCSLLLNKSSGILLVLCKNASKAELKTCRDLTLSFLLIFIPRISTFVQPYAEDVKKSCLSVFRNDRYSRNREKALQILIKMIENRKARIPFGGEEIKELVSKNLFQELAKSASNTTSSVRSQVFQVFGSLARYFPGHMTNWSERLYEIFLRELKLEMESKKTADLKIIEGSLLGLHGLMYSFTSAYDEEPDRCREIYKYAKTSIQQRDSLTRYAVPVAAMKIFRDHSSQFGNLLVEDFISFFSALETWFEHKNNDLKHAAHMAIISFLQQVTRNISEGDRETRSSKQLFSFFMEKFKVMLDTSDLNNKALSVAIKGYGLFAGPCKRFLPKSEVRFMFSQMMNQCEKLFLNYTHIPPSDKLQLDGTRTHQLPIFIQSLASITRQIESKDGISDDHVGLPESYRISLCRLSVVLIERYPKLHRKYAILCHNALISVAVAFLDKPEVLKSLLESLVYQGLIRCCSYDVVVGEERETYFDLNEDAVGDEDLLTDILFDSRTMSFRDYIPLWLALLGQSEKQEVNFTLDQLVNFGHRKICHEMYTTAFVKAIIDIVGKLNLATSTEEDRVHETTENPGLTENLKAVNVTDFKIFVNLVDICWELLPKAVNKRTSNFLTHIPTLVNTMVQESQRHPLVSGFYKMLAALMGIASKLSYFDSEAESSEDTMEHDGLYPTHENEQYHVLQLLQKYAAEVSARSKQYKDELLTACLFFILSLPAQVCGDILPQLMPAIQRACQLGLSYMPLSDALMSALLTWKSVFISNKKCYQDLVVHLQPYFNISEETSTVTQDKLNLKTKSKSFVKKLTALKQLDDPARKKARNQVIRFVGSISCSLDDQDEDACLGIAPWDEDVNIQYPLPFRDLKPTIRLDKFLPRVMDLATQGGDRKSKIAACELLHSITIYIIGRNAQINNVERNTHSMASLYKKLIPAILRLVCDVDQVCKQLFDPLTKQMIHWFTNNKKFESQDTATLLNSIMNGLVDDENASLRELCADSVREFLVWSIKQNPNSEKKVRNNAKSIFKRVHSLALHPSPMKRLGASLAFNHIYRVFREQETLVDEFIFETLVTFVNSLSLSHDDEQFLGTQKSCIQVLKHIARIVSGKSEMLCKSSSIRRIPRDLTNTESVTLYEVVEWLFDQCGRPQTECRRQCMHLFHEFTKLLPPESRSSVLWVNRKLTKDGVGYLIRCFEGGSDGGGITSQPMLKRDNFTTSSACQWFDLVFAAVEVYDWLFQQKILTPTTVWAGPESNSSNLFKCLNFFMQSISSKSAMEIALFSSKSKETHFSPREISLFNYSKFTVVTRILQLFTTMLNNYPKEDIKIFSQKKNVNEAYVELLFCSITNPAMLGFDSLKDADVANLTTLNENALKAALKHLPQNNINELIAKLTESLATQGNLSESLPIPFGTKETGEARLLHLICGYQTLHRTGLLQKVLLQNKVQTANNTTSIANTLLSLVFDSVVTTEDLEGKIVSHELSPKSIDLGSKLLQLVFLLFQGLEENKGKLVESIFNNEQIASSDFELDSTTNKGLLFLSAYSVVIYTELCQHPAIYVPLVTKYAAQHCTTCNLVLMGMLEHLATNRTARKNYAIAVCDAILHEFDGNLKQWKVIENEADNLSNLITLLRKIISLDSSVCTKPSHANHQTIFQLYTIVLSSNELNLTFKNQFLDLLTFFTISPTHSEEIKETLERFVSNHFPLSSSEFKPGSSAHNNYTTAIRKLLDCLELSGNLAVLNVMVTIYCRDQGHVMSDEIINTLEKCVASIPAAEQKAALDVPYTIFEKSPQRSITAAQTAITRVLVPMAQKCDVTAVIEFFQSHIPHIMAIVQEEPVKYPESKWSRQLKLKSLAYRLLELMFALLPEDQTKPSSPVNHAYQNYCLTQPSQNSTSFIKSFMLRANRDRNENMKGEKVLLEDRRQFHCGVYNALVAAVISTQDTVKWFKVFLFDENPAKQQYFLDNVMDNEKVYQFDIEINQPLKKRKQYVAIRKKKAEEQKEESVRYMASLAGSSLSEEVSVFDGNASRTISHAQTSIDPGSFSAKLDGTFENEEAQSAYSTSFHGNFVELEGDILNEHECMPAMVGLITHMYENSIGFPEESKEDSSIPSWMSSMLKKMNSASTSRNVRLFIAKLIINCEPYIRSYATHWITALVQVILKDDCGTAGIDTMVCDVLVTVLSWNSIAIPENSVEGKSLVRGLLEKICPKIHHSNRSILRHNLDLIKTTLECWGERVADGIDPSIVFQLCQCSDPDLKDNFAGLQLLGAFLVNQCSPFAAVYTYDIEREQYYQRIFRNLLFKRKEIYDSASEVAGLTLKHISNVDKEDNSRIHDMVRAKLMTLFKNHKTSDMFITCLHKVALHYPPMVDHFISMVTGLIPKMYGDLRTYCYEILNQRAAHIEDLYLRLNVKNLITNFSVGSDALQLVSLRLCSHIAKANMDSLSGDTAENRNRVTMEFLPDALKVFSEHSNPVCRQEAMELSMMLYDYQKSLSPDSHSNDILTLSKLFLLKCLSDPEELLRNRVMNFWSEETRLAINPLDKVTSIFGELYEPSLDESKFLCNAVGLLLQSSSLSPDFDRAIFELPLSECTFQEYTIDNSWRHQYASLLPMFVETLGGSPGASISSKPEREPNELLATQSNLQFTATVEGGKSAYNWMTGSSLDTFSSVAARDHNKSSLLASTFTSLKSRHRRNRKLVTDKPGPEFQKIGANNQFGTNRIRASGVDVDVQRLRRRYLKQQNDSRIHFARAQEIKKRKQESANKEHEKRRSNDVTLHRKYRDGELPDVQISNRSIIAPLASACQHDATLSRSVLSSLVSAILREERGKDGPNGISPEIRDKMFKILEVSSEKNPALIGCVEDVALHNHDFAGFDKLIPAHIAASSLKSNKHALGITLLEQYIIDDKHTAVEPLNKRRKTAVSVGIEKNPELWIELARLYKSLGEFDVLQGIFGGDSQSNKLTAEGLALEGFGDFRAASKIYQQALNEKEWKEEVSDLEKDIWEECLINCFKNLTRWDRVNKMCDMELADYVEQDTVCTLKDVWKSPEYQQRFLDSAVHSKLLLLLQGDTNVGNELSDFFDHSMKSSGAEKNTVERNYSEDLAIMYIYKGDYDSARFYTDKAADSFSQQWSILDPLMTSRKQSLLRIIPRLNDINDFLDLITKPGVDFSSFVKNVKMLISRWTNNLPNSQFDPIHAWNDCITYRSFFMGELQKKMSENESQSQENGDDMWIKRAKFKMTVKMAESARLHGNFSVASNLHSALEQEEEILDRNKGLSFMLTHEVALCYIAQGRRLVPSNARINNKMKYFIAAMECLNEKNDFITSRADTTEKIQHHLAVACTHELISENLDESEPTDLDQVQEILGTNEQLSDVRESLSNNAFKFYLKAAKLGELLPGTDSHDLQQKSYMALAYFCDKQLRMADTGEALLSNQSVRVDFAVTMTTYVLRAMKMKAMSSDATWSFPRLLELVEEFKGSLIDSFIHESSTLPSWMALGWLGHLVSLLDRSIARAIHPILDLVMRVFPQAVIFPFKTALEGFKFEESDIGKKNKLFVKKLKHHLKQEVPLADEFVLQLRLICHPSIAFKDWIEGFTNLFKSKESSRTKHIVENYQNMHNDLFQCGSSSSLEENSLHGRSSVNKAGTIWKKFSEKFKMKVEKMFGGSTGDQLSRMTGKQFGGGISSLLSEVEKFKQVQAGTLKDYSPWLSKFQSLPRSGKELEIPGQYDGRSRPLTEYHATITGFDDRVLMMSSLRRPHKIIIRGSNEKDYGFLIKGGEDMRQDQRIEQIFVAVNELLKSDWTCRKRNLSIKTYQVIPISSKVGMIEWVENVVPYQEFLSKQANRMNCSSLNEPFKDWIPKNVAQTARSDNKCEIYGTFAQYGNYAQVVEKIKKAENCVPWDLFRQAYMRLCSNPESFVALRKRFTSSYAVMCVTHWLLGIGDRHTSNFMVSLKTGEVMGIDFGHAFGSATEVLPVPELVPFRVTNQIINMLSPHSPKHGEMRHIMVRCLTALRSRVDTILPLLDVFVKDPSVDWTRFAKKSRERDRRCGGTDVESSDPVWYAKRKMKIVERKLKGENPSSIICDELNHNNSIQRFKQYYCSIATGDSKNLRSQVPTTGLSVSQQIDCLLDLATDPNVLGRMWVGWKPWL